MKAHYSPQFGKLLTCVLSSNSDFGRNVADSPIPTPFIDQLTAQGVHLTQHYVHSVCSPTRAALLTGRYHVNTGMTNVLIPGTPAGNFLNALFSCSCDSLILKHRRLLCDLTRIAFGYSHLAFVAELPRWLLHCHGWQVASRSCPAQDDSHWARLRPLHGNVHVGPRQFHQADVRASLGGTTGS